MTQGPSPLKKAPRRSRRAEPEPLRKAAERARTIGRLISPHSTRDARELRDLDRRLSAFARERPRVGVVAVQPGSGASTVSRLIGRTLCGRTPTDGTLVEDFGSRRLRLEDLTALLVVTKAELSAIPAARDFVATLGEQRQFAFSGRVILVVNQLGSPAPVAATELKLAVDVRNLRRAGLLVVSLAHDPALAHAAADHIRWAPRTALTALRLGAAVLGGDGS